MQEFIISMMEQFGYIGVALLIALENVFPPIPSEVILTFGGFMTTYANLHPLLVSLAATVGSVLGAGILYAIGRALSVERLEKILSGRLGRLLRVKPQDVHKAGGWFEKKGGRAVFFCRFVPIIRSLISIPAGMSKMPVGRFLALTTVGTAIWNVVLVYLGVFAGASWETIVGYLGTYSTVALVVIVAALAVAGFLFYCKRIAKKKNISSN